MATLMLCPTCKGVMGDTRAPGKRCTCTSPGGVATFTVSGPKLCSVCSADVTDKKRMKDGVTGRYWCYDCFVIEQRKKNSGMTMRCAKCQKDCPPVRMIKHGEAWWCDQCDAGDGKGKKAKKGDSAIINGAKAGARGTSTEAQSGKSPLLIGGLVVTVAAAAIYYFYMM
jgi:hypothetical protein